MQTQDNIPIVIEKETEVLSEKPFHRPPSDKSIH